MKILLRTPAPYLTESLLGYILRLSEENGYDSPWHIFVQAGIHQGEVASPALPINKLASVTGKSSVAYETIAYRNPAKTTGYQLLGNHLGDSPACRPLRLRRPACCPLCIEEFGFVDAFWDLHIASACPIHRIEAITACSDCGDKLSWFRPGLLRCKCGAILRTASKSHASESVLQLMEVVRARLHGTIPQISVSESLPWQALARLSLRELIAFIRQFGKFAMLASTGKSKGPEEDIVKAAAGALSCWPNGFHDLLRGLVNLPGVKAKSPSIVAHLNGLYTTMLSGRNGHKFLREEFVLFGAQEWGDGLVDARMVPAGISPRFTSLAELSKRSGIDSRTLSRWAADGKLSIKEVEGERRSRYVVDSSGVTAKSGVVGQLVEARRAARIIGIPVAVLAALKRDQHGAHYVSAHSPAIKCGYHSVDLEVFRLKLLGRAAAACPLPQGISGEDTISLDAVMRHTRFGGASHKAAFLGRYLDGSVEGFLPAAGDPGEVVFLRSMVEIDAGSARASHDSVVKTRAAEMLSCSTKMIDVLVGEGYIRVCSEKKYDRVLKASIEDFLENYSPLPPLAVQLRTKIRVLLRLAEEMSLSVLQWKGFPGSQVAFVRRSQVWKLQESLAPKFRAKRVPPDEVLKKYLDALAESGERIPRKGLVPNKIEIARACGFLISHDPQPSL
jgi:hypothetical protein